MEAWNRWNALIWTLGLIPILGALIFACSSNTIVANPTNGKMLTETKVATTTIITSPPSLSPTVVSTSVQGLPQVLLFDDWPKDSFPADAAKITAITLDENILKIHVVYQGGCQEHTFALYAWTGFLLSNPPQGEIYLSQDAHGDTCTENVKKLFSFDLTPLDQSRAGRQANPLLLRIYEPGSFAKEPYIPLIEWP